MANYLSPKKPLCLWIMEPVSFFFSSFFGKEFASRDLGDGDDGSWHYPYNTGLCDKFRLMNTIPKIGHCDRNPKNIK